MRHVLTLTVTLSYQGMLDIRVWDGLIPAASSMSDPSSAAVVL
jgi:hypothetical protein